MDVSRSACAKEIDLTRDWQEHLIACDASVSFGFGVAVARCPKLLVREIGRAGQKRDVYARVVREGNYPDEEAERPRKGRAIHIPLAKSAFVTVV